MNHSMHRHSSGFRWIALCLSTVLLMTGIGARPIAGPQEPPSPATERVEQWDAAAPRPLVQDMPAPAEQAAAVAEVECQFDGFNPTPVMNISTSFVHQIFSLYWNSWEIKVSNFCDFFFSDTVINSHPANDTLPRLSFDAKRVAFVSDRNKNADIFVSTFSGEDLRQLTSDPAADSMPAFSPDGQRIVFASDRAGNPDLFTMNADGSGQTALTSGPEGDVHPDWSPDGKRIAFVRRSGSWGQIMLINPNGSGLTALTGNIFLPWRVRWSPDGKKLAFEYDHNGDGWIDLGIINADGSGFKNILQAPAANHVDFELGNWANDLSYLAINQVSYLW